MTVTEYDLDNLAVGLMTGILKPADVPMSLGVQVAEKICGYVPGLIAQDLVAGSPYEADCAHLVRVVDALAEGNLLSGFASRKISARTAKDATDAQNRLAVTQALAEIMCSGFAPLTQEIRSKGDLVYKVSCNADLIEIEVRRQQPMPRPSAASLVEHV